MSSVSDSLKSFASAMEVSTTNPCANDLTPEEYEEYTSLSKGGFTTSDPLRKRFYRLMAAGKERKRQEAIEATAGEIEEKILGEIEERLQPLRKDILFLLPPPPRARCLPLCILFVTLVFIISSILLMEIIRSHYRDSSTELVIFEGSC